MYYIFVDVSRNLQLTSEIFESRRNVTFISFDVHRWISTSWLFALWPIDLVHDIVVDYTGIPSSRFHFYVRGTQARYLINDAPARLEDDI